MLWIHGQETALRQASATDISATAVRVAMAATTHDTAKATQTVITAATASTATAATAAVAAVAAAVEKHYCQHNTPLRLLRRMSEKSVMASSGTIRQRKVWNTTPAH